MSKRRATAQKQRKPVRRSKRLRGENPSLDCNNAGDKNHDNDDDCVVEEILERSLRENHQWMMNMAKIDIPLEKSSQNTFPEHIFVPDEMCAVVFLQLETIEEILKVKNICKKWYYVIMLSPTDSICIWKYYEERYKRASSFVSRLYFGPSKKKEEKRGKKSKIETNTDTETKYKQVNKSKDEEKIWYDKKGNIGSCYPSEKPSLEQIPELSLCSQVLSIIHRLRRYRRNSLEMCSECGKSLDICSVLCKSCTLHAPLTRLSEENCRISTCADEIAFPNILEDGAVTKYSPSSPIYYILRHCSACHKIATPITLSSYVMVYVYIFHANSNFSDTFAMCSTCLQFYRERKSFHRNTETIRRNQILTFQEKIGNQCRDLIFCNSCAQSSVNFFVTFAFINSVLHNSMEGSVYDLSDFCNFWIQEDPLDIFLSLGPVDLRICREKILKASSHVSIFRRIELTSTETTTITATTTTTITEENDAWIHQHKIQQYLLKSYNPKEEKMVLRPWLVGSSHHHHHDHDEEYCKEKFSKIKLYFVPDLLFYYSLYKKEVVTKISVETS